MFDKRALRQDFGGAASGYDEHALLQREVREYGQKLAKDIWPAGAQILDVGSGTGAFAADMGNMWSIINLDLAFGMCAAAKLKNIRCINASAEALPFADDTFDGLFSSLMLQWAACPREMLEQMHRVLKPGGKAVITTFADGTLSELASAFASVDAAPHISQFPTAQMLAKHAEDAGFSIYLLREQRKLEHYPSLMALMHSLKNIGAVNKDKMRRRGLMTPRQLACVKENYPRESGALPVSWQMVYMVLEKTNGS